MHDTGERERGGGGEGRGGVWRTGKGRMRVWEYHSTTESRWLWIACLHLESAGASFVKDEWSNFLHPLFGYIVGFLIKQWTLSFFIEITIWEWHSLPTYFCRLHGNRKCMVPTYFRRLHGNRKCMVPTYFCRLHGNRKCMVPTYFCRLHGNR